MQESPTVEIKKSKLGGMYYTLFIDGQFRGNYDRYGEAVEEAEQLLYSSEAKR